MLFNFRMSSRNKGTGKRSSQNQTSNGFHDEKRLKNGHDQNGHSQNNSSSQGNLLEGIVN
jgi:hypothetical protein